MPQRIDNQRKAERFEDVLETAPLAIYEIDYKMLRFKRVNQAMCILSGYSEEELLSMNPADLLDVESTQRFKDRIKQGLAGQKIDESVEFKLKVKNGRDIWAILRVKPTYKDGKLDSALVVGYDITERKKTEEALVKSERKYSTLVERPNSIVMTVDKNLNIIFMNEFGLKFFGYKPDEIIGKNVIGTTIPSIDDEGNDLAEMARNLAKNVDQYKTNVHKNMLKDGRLVWVSWTNSGIYDENGELSEIIAVGNDISKIKEAEEALRDREEEYKFLLQNAPIAIYEIDFNGQHFKSFNDGLCILSGFSREELLTKKPSDLLVAESQERFRERIQRTLTGERIDENIEYRGVRKDGRKIWVTIKVKFSSANGKFDSALAVAHDITELKETRDKLEEYGKNLERLIEERTKQLKDAERLATIGATAGMVGHDIRNPLQAISSDVYLAKMDLATLPESEEKMNLKESISEIEKNASYINKIVEDLQDFARPLSPKNEETDIEQTIASVIAALVIPENVTVEQYVGKDFPKLKTDPTYIQRIITNLTNNAIQAMPKGGKVTITAVLKDDKAVISVEDTGIGIPENVRSKIFTPLVTTKSKGQGFGLSVVKRFTDALGGTVTFETEVEKGTKFTIELPVDTLN
jgi:PAS domain S-box-containing protein